MSIKVVGVFVCVCLGMCEIGAEGGLEPQAKTLSKRCVFVGGEEGVGYFVRTWCNVTSSL